MQRILVVLAVLGTSSPALARPGFTVALGIGGTSVGGQTVAIDRLHSSTATIAVPPSFTTDIDGGLNGLFSMGFNILGYGALETRLTGGGHSLTDATKRQWAAHWQTGIRAYPLWHWQALLPDYLQPLEPSIFFGLGASYQGYAPNPVDEVGWSRWGTWSLGLGVEYFIISYFKVMLDYTYIHSGYNNFILDFEDSINFDVEPTASTGFHQFFVVAAFQFGPAQEPVRY